MTLRIIQIFCLETLGVYAGINITLKGEQALLSLIFPVIFFPLIISIKIQLCQIHAEIHQLSQVHRGVISQGLDQTC